MVFARFRFMIYGQVSGRDRIFEDALAPPLADSLVIAAQVVPDYVVVLNFHQLDYAIPDLKQAPGYLVELGLDIQRQLFLVLDGLRIDDLAERGQHLAGVE